MKPKLTADKTDIRFGRIAIGGSVFPRSRHRGEIGPGIFRSIQLSGYAQKLGTNIQQTLRVEKHVAGKMLDVNKKAMLFYTVKKLTFYNFTMKYTRN